MKLYYKNNDCISSALRQFATLKGLKNQTQCPSYNSIKRMIERFELTGNCDKLKPPGRPSGDSESKVHEHIAETETGQVTCRKSGTFLGISKSHMQRILRKSMNLFPYKPQLDHYLSENSINERTVFCEKFLISVDTNDDFLEKILFSDESIFELNSSCINKQNNRFWALEKPDESHFTVKSFPQKCMVWCGFTANFVVGPYFFTENVTSESYQTMITDFVIPELKKKRKFSHTILMQDGATPHTSASTKELLKRAFGNRIISRGLDFEWPSYSPDLNPLDFAFWGHIKNLLYMNRYTFISEMKRKITEIIDDLDLSFYKNSVYSLLNRCILCLESGGSNF